MNHAPIFDLSLFGIQTSKINSDLWQEIVQTFDEKKYKETVLGVLNYIDNSIIQKRGNAELSEFTIPDGSSVVYISLKDGMFSVKSPFIQLPEKGAVGILRQVAEINFNRLVLSQIVLRDKDKLFFEYECPLEMTDPYKVYAIFEEICLNGDYYDDIFREKFGAKLIEEEKVTPFSSEDLQKAWEKYHQYLQEAFDYVQFFECKRMIGFCWDVLNLTLMKIDYYMEPQGFLRSEIEKTIADLNNSNVPLNELVNKGKAALQKLKNLEKEKFDASMHKPNVFIPAKKKCDITCVQNMLKKGYENSKTEIGGTDYMGATLSLLFGVFNMHYRNSIPTDIAEILNEGLANASGKQWKEAAENLWKAVDKVMEQKPEHRLTS